MPCADRCPLSLSPVPCPLSLVFYTCVLHRDAAADAEKRGARAFRAAGERGAGVDGVEADVEAERKMPLDEPARAAPVVDGLQVFAVGRLRLLAVGNERPGRRADTAAEVTPPVAITEVERQLRRDVREALGDGAPV